jgi:hypothetical protein
LNFFFIMKIPLSSKNTDSEQLISIAIISPKSSKSLRFQSPEDRPDVYGFYFEFARE